MSDPGDKQYEASQKKLDDARRKGELPRSADLTTAGAYAGLVLAAVAMGPMLFARTGSVLMGMLGNAPDIAAQAAGGTMQGSLGGFILRVIAWISPWFIAPALLVILTIISQRSFVIAPDKIRPRANRISIISNARNKFGRNGLFEFTKNLLKLCAISLVLWLFLRSRLAQLLNTPSLDAMLIGGFLLHLTLSFLKIILLIVLLIGITDFIWQKAEHLRRHRMSRQEVADEAKHSEGDPHMKQARRHKGQEIALNKMLSDVPTADVVIVNPQHFAVALKWDRSANGAPECVAKGVDEIARKIREVAAESGVPIHRDPPTARALHASLEIGQQIRPEHYRAVAVAIRFADAIARKQRNWK